MEYAQRIGARIARLRTEKHLTQGQLAQAAGVPRDALARWEAGGGLPGRAELTALARPLGTTAAALLNADEDEPDEAPVGFLTFPRTGAGMARPSPLYARQRAAHGLCAGGAVLYRLRCFEPRLAVRLRAYGLHRRFFWPRLHFVCGAVRTARCGCGCGPPAKEILRPFRQPYTPPTAAGIKTENLTGWSTST